MKTLDTTELDDLLDRDRRILLLNVLDRASFEKEHIPGSHNVPLGSSGFEREVEQLAAAKDQPVVVYCASETCDASSKAARRLEQAGFTRVYDYEGGMQAWNEAGREVKSGAGSARRPTGGAGSGSSRPGSPRTS